MKGWKEYLKDSPSTFDVDPVKILAVSSAPLN